MNTDSEKIVTEVSRLESEIAGLCKAYVRSSQVFPTLLHLPQKCNGSFSVYSPFWHSLALQRVARG